MKKAALTETFFKRRSYTHQYDDLAKVTFDVINQDESTYWLQHPTTPIFLLKVMRDEVYIANENTH